MEERGDGLEAAVERARKAYSEKWERERARAAEAFWVDVPAQSIPEMTEAAGREAIRALRGVGATATLRAERLEAGRKETDTERKTKWQYRR